MRTVFRPQSLTRALSWDMPFVPAAETDLRKASESMKNWTQPWTTGIYGDCGGGSRELIGTGLLLVMNGGLFLLTARHVVEKGRQAKYVSIVCSDGLSAVMNTSHWELSTPTLDLAACCLGSVSSLTPATLGVVASSSSAVADHHLFVHGFPGARSRFTAFFGNQVVSDSVPYLTYLASAEAPTDWKEEGEFHPTKHFLIDYPAPEHLQIDQTGAPIALPNPAGMSGSAVWELAKDLTFWKVPQSRIVGIAIRWDPITQTLVVTRVEEVRTFLLEVLWRRSSYFRWLNAGRPAGTALQDWLSAKETVTQLQ